MKTLKQHRKKIVADWITMIKKSTGGRYRVDKLNPAALERFVETATATDLKCLAYLMSAAFTHGCDTTRTHIRELRKVA